jgi:hypothetical protein
LGEKNIGLGEFKGFRERGFGSLRIGLGSFRVRVEVVEYETGLGACKLKNVLMQERR